MHEVFNILDFKDKLARNQKRLDHRSIITQTTSVMGQKGFWNFEQRQQDLFNKNKTLKHLNEIIPWELFRAELEALYDKERKSNAGRKPMDVILMFKLLILQQLYNISDE